MLLIGDLNEQEPATVGANQTPPKPLPKALDIMLTEFDNPQQIDAVRLACLVGILRHAELTRVGMEIPEASRQKITTSCLTLLAAAQPPAGRSKDGHVWMQRRAMEILGALGSPGPNGEVAQALDQFVRDEKGASLRMRCTAADALGRLEFPSDPGLDVDKTARGLGTITISVCRTHGDRFKERLQERDMGGGAYWGYGGYGGESARPPAAVPGNPYGRGAGATSRDGGGRPSSGYQTARSGRGRGAAGGGYGYDGYGAAGGLEEEPEIPEDPLLTEARRALKHHLGCVKNGLSGTEKLAPQHDGVKELKQIVDGLLASLDKEELDAAQLLEAVDERATQLETAFGIPGPESKSPGGWPGPPGPPPNVPA